MRTVTYKTYLNVYIIATYYPKLLNTALYTYQVRMTYSNRKSHLLALANYLPPYYYSYVAKLFLFSA